MLRLLMICAILLSTLSGCLYRMPEDDEFSTVPVTNNPHYTKDPGKSLPGMMG